MGELVFTTERLVAAAPERVFAQLGRPGSGWLLGFACDRVEPGAVVRFDVPGMSGPPLRASGRLIEVVAGRRLVIRQETPWNSRLTVTFRPVDGGTKVRMLVELGEDCVPWLLDQQSDLPGDDRAAAIVLGVLVSLSGSAGLLGRAAVNAAELAVEQINSGGGIRGIPVRLAIADDRSMPARAAEAFRRLVTEERAAGVVAMVPSDSFRAVAPLARRRQVLLMQSPLTEGGCGGRTIFQLGERPADQLTHSIPALMAHTGATGWFVVGSDYCWPRAVAEVAGQIIHREGGRLLEHGFVGRGTDRFDRVIDHVERSGAELVLSALVGYDAVHFEQAMYAAGLRTKVKTLAALLDDSVREHIGDAAAAGIWSVLDHFGSPADPALTLAWQARFGPWAPPMSGTALSVYEAINLYAKAAHLARSTDSLAVAEQLRGARLGRSRMLARAAGERRLTAIAEAVEGGFRIHAPAV
jgi:urea transport system substrate-binding protein